MGVAGKIDALLAKIETERAKYDAAYDEALGCGDNASLVNGEMEDALDIIGRELAEIRKAITG